jgi:1,4-dihydroxy-2-naphthoate octaprenyltransferase
MELRTWITAFRLRTLPLALACIGMGGFLAASEQAFRWDIFLLCAFTTIFLQILSNLANDYGDSVHGADHSGRKGPSRAVQTGAISREKMRRALVVFVALCLASGLWLLWVSLGINWNSFLFFFALGILSIAAAVAYTVGSKPYGYAGLGDFSVLIFFGVVGVMGSTYLFTQQVVLLQLLPAVSCGFFSMGVLNINNIRDMESDRKAGKYSIPVRIGRRSAVIYHWFLILGGISSALIYTLLAYRSPWQLLFLISLPLFLRIGFAVQHRPAEELDPYLKRMAITTLLFVVMFGLGLILG